MPADNELDPLDRWLNQQVRPLPPPPGTFELITKRARRRRVRKAVISVACAAAVAAAVGVAVPVGMSLHLTPTSTNAAWPPGAQRAVDRADAVSARDGHRARSRPRRAPRASASAEHRRARAPTPRVPAARLPALLGDLGLADHRLGPGARGDAGPLRRAADSGICTSIARTDDGGQTWQGLPAPTGGPNRDGRHRAAVPQRDLRLGVRPGAVGDGRRRGRTGTRWTPAASPSPTWRRSTAEPTRCSPTAGTLTQSGRRLHLVHAEDPTAGSDDWTPVGGVPVNLTGGSATHPAAGQRRRDSNWPARRRAAGDRLPGRAGRHAVRRPPGRDRLAQGRGAALQSGRCRRRRAAAGAAASARRDNVAPGRRAPGDRLRRMPSGQHLRLPVDRQRGELDRADRRRVTWAATTVPAVADLLAGRHPHPRGDPRRGGTSGGIYLLSPGAAQWQAATLSDPSGKTYGFTYVGMTSATQGVALGGNPDLHAIWMTSDGGQTWHVRPIQS